MKIPPREVHTARWAAFEGLTNRQLADRAKAATAADVDRRDWTGPA